MIRGQYDKKGDKVEAGHSVGPRQAPDDAPKNRLGLAGWITARENPLTARVTVNRFWQQYFGTGLVKTPEDFGAQGEWPTHPELLDWLSVDFAESGWDIKRLQKLIVTSATYRQSSQVTPEHLSRDPSNELLTRGPRFRIDAEMVRDQALYLGGLLSERLGGRAGASVSAGRNLGSRGFQGEQHRILQARPRRLALPPHAVHILETHGPATLDGHIRRSQSRVVRGSPRRTNTPLQALVLMNDKQFVEAARFFAERAMREGGASSDERLAYAFRLATARRAKPDELAVLGRVFQKHLADYKANADAAKSLLDVGDKKTDLTKLDPAELAAYTMTTSLILNLDETITKE